jgi:hypothetical protein
MVMVTAMATGVGMAMGMGSRFNASAGLHDLEVVQREARAHEVTVVPSGPLHTGRHERRLRGKRPAGQRTNTVSDVVLQVNIPR